MKRNTHRIIDYDAVIDAKFGKDGSPERARAEEAAYAFYSGQILKNARREAKVFHEELNMTKIETREQYEWALARVEELLPLVDDDTPRNDPNSIELERLSNLVADYSDENFAIGKPTDAELRAEQRS